MLLKSIKLNNIRSYLNEKIDFPSGSLLLSGDIGSGKSTILLAIEFALFGSKPSELPASSLLRHGQKEGYVELNLELENKNIFIKRNLKRGKNAIKQEIGYIITNDVKKELSPVEMKADIFDLLGYPKDLVSKGKDLIYRYTVYTPQEEMKKILMEDKDARLNTLRKVFNIDKYKRIRENSLIFIRGIKEKRKEIEGFTSDLGEKEKEKENFKKEISDLNEKLKTIEPKVKDAKTIVEKKRQDISKYEEKIKILVKLKNDFSILEIDLKNLLTQRENNNNGIEKLITQIKAVEKELSEEKADDGKKIKEKIEDIEKNILNLNENIKIISQKLSESRILKTKSEEIISKISKIEKCPLCLQNVAHEHKNSIQERENKIIAEAEETLKIYSEKENETNTKLKEIEKEKEILRKAESRIELIKLKIKNLEDKKNERIKLEKLNDDIKKNIGEINVKKADINKKIEEMKNIENEYKDAKISLDSALTEEKKIEIEKKGLETKNDSLTKQLASLQEEILKKQSAKEKLNYLIELNNWLENYFMGLMGTMEKHIMLQVHREFNELFKTWFNMMIEDESISVRLDDEFTPIMDQNGYETQIENLSGGEKTSVALSYRLALNKVINDVVSSIKTKEILMLDEPTDGFSSEQLDKIREVLDQLKIKQVIIVSHETKIESFVDNIVRIQKDEHVSSVV
ncbi:MAG: AAA family ATPase [Candidatus Woesearchaeota archaeon]|jgi:exonuclease SbcC|nr:AAA family ATPase [Candidatus Woesearchaeota archaeon]MDP7622915.1 AAA family ATPase [Candidatus Woesearchaeota archaeon]HJN56424.1 AAA family ATPase [Candidatus Woesearchaeota archaeon]|tara:strand:- start:8498 stop:10561 length:2064 start_codon:yes stop_codon:yes gene_type:complete